MSKFKKSFSVISLLLILLLVFNLTAVAFDGMDLSDSTSGASNENNNFNYPETVNDKSQGTPASDEKLRLPEVTEAKSDENLGKLIKTEKYYKTYKTANGKFKTVYSDVPNYYNQKGSKIDYDNTLVEDKTFFGDTYYEAASSNVDVKLPTEIKEGKGVTFEYNDVKVDLKPMDGDYTKSTTLENAILYNNVFDGVDVQYTLYELGLKEDIILNKYVDISSFSYELDAHGDKAVLEDGMINIYKDDSTTPSYTITAPVMTDANGAISTDVKLSLAEKDGKNIVTVKVSPNWISAPERAFPIKIDPNISLSNETLEVYSFTEYNNGKYGSKAFGYAGYLTARAIGDDIDLKQTRMLIDINANFNDIIPEEANVTSANFNIYEYGDRNNGKTAFECQYIAQPWNENISWGAMKDLETHPSSPEGDGGFASKSYEGWHSFNIMGAVTNWLISGNSSQNGLLIKASENENNPGAAFFTEYSSWGHCGFNGTQVPNISIEWELDNPVPQDLTVENMNINLRPINTAKRDGTLQFLGIFADGLTAPGSTVSYSLNDSSKEQDGTTRASASYKYPTTASVDGTWTSDTKKYGRNFVSNWQTSKIFTNFDFDTLYNYSANATLNGTTGPTNSSQKFLIYKIKQFDNFTKIANYYGVDVYKLRADNRAQDGLLIANNTIAVINPTRNGNNPYNPAPLSNADKAKIDSLLMGRGLHCEFGFEPVNINTGDFYMNQTDSKIDDLNGPFEISRTYNSKGASINSLFGRGWSFDYDEGLTRLEDGTVVYSKGDGSSIQFTPNSDGTYTCPDGYYLNLNKIYTGTESYVVDDETIAYDIYEYEIKDSNGTIKHFNRYGLLNKITDKKGFVTTLNYDANYNLSSIVSPAGARYVLGYTPEGFIGSVVLPNGAELKYNYDSNNNLTSYTDANGNTTKYAYNSNHEMTSWSDANGDVVNTNEYDSQGRVTKQKDANGKVTTFQYGDYTTTTTDANGNTTVYIYDSQYRTTRIDYADGTFETKNYDNNNNLASITNCAGKTTTYDYDSKGNIIKETRFDGAIKTYEYNSDNNITKQKDFDGKVNSFEYNSNGDLIKKVDNIGNIINYEYDNLHRLTKQIDANSNETSYTYNGAWIASKTDSLGNKISYYYNALGQVVSTVDAKGNIKRYTYDNGGRKIQEQAANGAITKYDYDKAGNVIAITDAKGYKYTFGYDGIGNMIWSRDALSNKTVFTYDGLNNKTSETDPLGNKTTFIYNCKSKMISKTDALSNKTTYEYDALGNLTKTTDPKGNVTENTYDLRFNKIKTYKNSLDQIISYEYDAAGNLVKQTDLNSGVIEYEYDAINRLSKVKTPTGLVTEYSYDSNSNIISSVDNANRTISYEYDKLNRNISQTYANGSVVKYAYDDNSNLISKTDTQGNVTTYKYDENNQKTSETDSLNRTTKYEYDLNGNLIKQTASNGSIKSYEYNSYDLVSKEIDNNGNHTLYSYDANENLVSKTDVYGNSETYTYTANNLISSVTDVLGNKYTMSYDENGNNIKIVAPNDAKTIMEYDSGNRLIKQTNANGLVTTNTYNINGQIENTSTNSGKNDSYSYDKAGRMIKHINALDNAEKYEYDIADNLIAYTGTDGNKTTYTYDVFGNIASSTDAEDKTTTYSYDLLNNLLRKKDSQSRTYEYKYDAASRLLEEKDPLNTITAYEYNSLDLLTKTTKAGVVQNSSSYDLLGRLTELSDANGNKKHFEYDALGRTIKMTSANGAVDEYLYDANSNLIKHKNPQNAIISYTYDNMGNLSTKTMPNGGVFTYAYDSVGNQISIKDPLSNVTSLKYDLDSKLISKTLANGAEQTYSYDALGRINKQTNDILSKSYAYDGKGNISSETDGSNRTTKYTYDKMHRMLSATNARGGVTSYSYDDSGNLTNEKTPLGNATTYTYDALDRITKKLNPVGQVEEYTYNALGNLEKLTTNGGRTYTYSYDNNGNLKSSTNALGQTLNYEYDSMNQLVSETDYKGKATKYTYDLVGDLKSVTARNGGVTSFDYDLSGNLITKNDAENRKTEYGYDLLNRLTQVKEGDITTAKYGHDSVGNLTSYTNGNENTTTYTYNKLGKQTSITDPLGNVTEFTYNKNGLLEKTTNPNKTTVNYDYDELDALLSKSYDEEDQTQALYAYDLDGNRVSMADVQGKTGYEYDAAGRITAVKLANGTQKIKYTYDEFGNLQKLEYPDGSCVKYSYDELNRLVSIEDKNSRKTSYTYDANGNVTKVTRPNNTYSVITYDDSDKVTSVKNIKLTKNLLGKWEESEISSFSYEYDLTGLIKKETATQKGVTKERAFIYDQRSQIALVNERTTLNCGKTWSIRNIAYTYDNAGNCIKETESNGFGNEYVTEYTYDKADRLTKQSTNLNYTTLTTDYNYDANGNLTKEKSNYKFQASASVDVNTPDFDFGLDADIKVNLTTVEKSYKYNNENRLTAVKEGGRLLMAALYDGDGERIFTLNNKCADGYTYNNEGTALNCYLGCSSGDGKITYNTDVIKNEILIPNGINKLESFNYELTGYINDTNQENTQVLIEYGANSRITNIYTYGLSRNSANIGGKENYYIYDGRGSVSQLTNSNGCIVASYGYDIYGETKTTNTLINNPYKYNAESTDSATGLQYLRARYYNSENHRFMTKDTYQGDVQSPLSRNNYAYANNNPVNFVDPTGNIPIIPILLAFGGGALFDATTSAITQKITTGEIKWGTVAKDAVIGGVINVALGPVVKAAKWVGKGALKLLPKGITNKLDDAYRSIKNLKSELSTKTKYFINEIESYFVYPKCLGDKPLILPTMEKSIKNNILDDVAGFELNGTRYSPVNPGPLKQSVAETFTGATYTQKALEVDTVFYRVSTNEAGKVGSYMTRTPQMGGMQSQLDLALNPKWGNTAQVITKVSVPKGTVIYEGKAASQIINGGAGLLPGGGNQVYIPEVNPNWFN